MNQHNTKEVVINFTTAGPTTEFEIELEQGCWGLHSIYQEVTASAGGAATHAPTMGNVTGFTASEVDEEIFATVAQAIATDFADVYSRDIIRFNTDKFYFKPKPDAGTITGVAVLIFNFYGGDRLTVS